jgi:hypothetical protein
MEMAPELPSLLHNYHVCVTERCNPGEIFDKGEKLEQTRRNKRIVAIPPNNRYNGNKYLYLLPHMDVVSNDRKYISCDWLLGV